MTWRESCLYSPFVSLGEKKILRFLHQHSGNLRQVVFQLCDLQTSSKGFSLLASINSQQLSLKEFSTKSATMNMRIYPMLGVALFIRPFN